MLFGRVAEQCEIDRLLTAARSGASGALVIRGEPGIGKSALLDQARDGATGMLILRVQAVESENELPFAALHLLLRPALDRLDRLPGAQADAMRNAFGLRASPQSDRFLVGIAALTLLSELGDDGPVLCMIDDAQWLDGASADALMFTARRLGAEGVAMIFTVRDDAPVMTAPGLPELPLGRLPQEAAGALLTERDDTLAPQARHRILEEAAGNPLALLELPVAFTPEQRSGRLGPLPFAVDAGPPSSRVQRELQAQIGGFPDAAQRALLVAAADDTGDLDVVLPAAERLGCGPTDLESVERAGLVYLSATALTFRHPLVRAAAYQVAPHARRVAAHRSIAAVLDADTHADRRAWHLATAATSPDEQVADELERVAERAQHRHGEAAASAAFERSAELTAGPYRAAERLVRAAHRAVRAGQPRRAVALADRAATLPGDPRLRAGRDHVLAAVEFEQGSPGTAARILVDGARRLATTDAATATRMLSQAARDASFGSDATVARDVAAELRAVGQSSLARGMCTVARLLGDEVVDDLAPIREAVAVLLAAPDDRWAGQLLAVPLSLMAGDESMAVRLATSLVAHCRERGMIGVLPQALTLLAQAQMLRSGLREATAAATEARDVARDIDQPRRTGYLNGILAWLAAVEGDEERCAALTEQVDPTAEAGRVMAAWATGLLHLGLGRPRLALDHLAPIWHDGKRHQTVALYAAPELIEAAAGADRPDLAAEPMRRLERWAAAIGRPWADAVVARSRGRLATGDEAERHYADAVRIYANEMDPGQPFQRARAELLYGASLRRAQRRARARTQLTAALRGFDRLGAAPWAKRTRAELRACGAETVAATPCPHGRLSPQERQVLRLAAEGLSNREIGAHLFLSPRTVGNHLYRAFPKLGIGSRNELDVLRFDDLD